MKIWMSALVVVLITGLVGVTEAAKDKGGVKGQITAIDKATKKLTVAGGNKKNPVTTEVTCDDKTTVTRDGKDATFADLQSGDYVTVSPTTGTATSIAASTTKPEKKPK